MKFNGRKELLEHSQAQRLLPLVEIKGSAHLERGQKMPVQFGSGYYYTSDGALHHIRPKRRGKAAVKRAKRERKHRP